MIQLDAMTQSLLMGIAEKTLTLKWGSDKQVAWDSMFWNFVKEFGYDPEQDEDAMLYFSKATTKEMIAYTLDKFNVSYDKETLNEWEQIGNAL